jgi:hypothetical protein
MLRVPLSGLADIWDDPSSDEDSANSLVLGRVLDDYRQARPVRLAPATTAGDALLPDRMDDAQAPPGNGEYR